MTYVFREPRNDECLCGHHFEDHQEEAQRSEYVHVARGGVITRWNTRWTQCLKCDCLLARKRT